jgi:hypothetical protein
MSAKIKIEILYPGRQRFKRSKIDEAKKEYVLTAPDVMQIDDDWLVVEGNEKVLAAKEQGRDEIEVRELLPGSEQNRQRHRAILQKAKNPDQRGFFNVYIDDDTKFKPFRDFVSNSFWFLITLLFAGGFLWLGWSMLRWIINTIRKLPPSNLTIAWWIGAGILAIVLGLGLFVIRERKRLYYAIAELAFAGITGFAATNKLVPLSATSNQSTIDLAAWATLIGSMYIGVRGWDNLKEGVKQFGEEVVSLAPSASSIEIVSGLAINIDRYVCLVDEGGNRQDITIWGSSKNNRLQIVHWELLTVIHIEKLLYILFGNPTIFLSASREGRVNLVAVLPKYGSDINVKDKSGMTPLMFAAMYGHLEVARKLLEFDVDIDAVSIEGNTALIYSIREKRFELALEILKYIESHQFQTHGKSTKSPSEQENPNKEKALLLLKTYINTSDNALLDDLKRIEDLIVRIQ